MSDFKGISALESLIAESWDIVRLLIFERDAMFRPLEDTILDKNDPFCEAFAFTSGNDSYSAFG